MYFISLFIDYQAAKLSRCHVKTFHFVIIRNVCLLNEKYYRIGETFGQTSRFFRRASGL